ncbi:MAG: PD40 domain-containing protein [Acidobacteria bacterium]|nr:PD40 domain-containing protein [Acidobacteriota bacterium]
MSPFEQVPGSWSPDGQTLAFTEYHPDTGADIWVLSFSGDPTPRPAVRTPFNEYGPMFSLDGAWIAYTSDESGQNEVYVVSAEGTGRKWQVSTDGGAEPIWHRDGSTLFYRNGARVMCAPVTVAQSFMAETPRARFEGPFEGGLPTGLPNYDVASDGRVLAVMSAAALPSPSELVVTLGWFHQVQEGGA